MRKFMVYLFAVIILSVFSFVGCSPATDENLSSENNPSVSYEEMSEEEFIAAALEMGYNHIQLEAIKEHGLSRNAVLEPLEHAPMVGTESATGNGEHFLGYFDFNGEPEGLKFYYVRKDENIQIVHFYAEHYECSIMNDEYFYCYDPEKGASVYSFEHMKCADEWIFSTASDKKYWNRGLVHHSDNKWHNLIMMFGITTGNHFSISNPSEQDVSAEYTIAYIDAETGTSNEIKTGIPVHFVDAEPAFVNFEGGDLHEIPSDFAFSICDRCYSLDLDSFEIKLEHDHDFENENFRFPAPPLEVDIASADPILLQYYEYFGSELGYLGDYTDENGFATKAMAMYLYDKYSDYFKDEEKWGVPKEKYIEMSEKHFGLNVLERSDFYIDDGTGFIVPAYGYSPSPSAFILKKRKENADGSITAVFYHIGLDYYEEGFYKNILRGASIDELLLSGQFGYFSDEVGLKEYRFFEHTDENGEFYVEFISSKILEPVSNGGKYLVYGENNK